MGRSSVAWMVAFGLIVPSFGATAQPASDPAYEALPPALGRAVDELTASPAPHAPAGDPAAFAAAPLGPDGEGRLALFGRTPPAGDTALARMSDAAAQAASPAADRAAGAAFSTLLMDAGALPTGTAP